MRLLCVCVRFGLQLRELREKAELWLYGQNVRNIPEYGRMLGVLADLGAICQIESGDASKNDDGAHAPPHTVRATACMGDC